MADMELFKTTLVGGYDKDDVERHIQKMKDEAHVDKNRLLQLLKQKDKQILDLSVKLESREEQLRQKDIDIKEKYQSYIDNYEQIGRLVFESRIRADRMIADARDESRRIIQEARNLAKRRLDQVEEQINDKLDEGREKHNAIRKEVDELLELLLEVRQRCMISCENVENLVGTFAEHEDPFANIMAELEAKTGAKEHISPENATFQEQINYMKNQLESAPEEMETFDEEDQDDVNLMDSIHRILEDETEDEEPKEFPDIQVLPVEEVLKNMREASRKEEGETEAEEEPQETEETGTEPAEEASHVSAPAEEVPQDLQETSEEVAEAEPQEDADGEEAEPQEDLAGDEAAEEKPEE